MKDKRSMSRARAKRELVILSLIPALVSLSFLVLSLVKQEPRITLRLLPLIALPLLAYVPAVHRWRVKRRRERLGESEAGIPVLTRQSYVHESKLKLVNIGVACLIVALAMFLPAFFWIREENNPDLWPPIAFFIAVPLIAGVVLLLVAWGRVKNRRKLLRSKTLRILELPLEKKEMSTRREYSDTFNEDQEMTSYDLIFTVPGKEESQRLSFNVSLEEYSRAREGSLYYCLVDVRHRNPSLERCYPKNSVRLGSDLALLLRDAESLEEEIRLRKQKDEETAQKREQDEERLRQMKAVGGEALREYRKKYREEHREELRKKQLRRWGFVLAVILFSAAAPFILPAALSFDPGWMGVLLVLGVFAFLFAALFVLAKLNDRWGVYWFLLIVALFLAGPFLPWV